MTDKKEQQGIIERPIYSASDENIVRFVKRSRPHALTPKTFSEYGPGVYDTLLLGTNNE